MDIFAFFGTGTCDPNKSTKEFLAFSGAVVGWIIIISLIRKINKSDKSNALKIGLSVLLITIGVIGSIMIFLITWFGLACSGYN